jgi:Spy/CpxP family protein refolding chaperone
MKRVTIIPTIAVVLLLMVFTVVRADTRKGQGWGSHGWHHSGPMSYATHELKLSNGQRAQIQTLWRDELPTISAHVHELLDENKEMNAIVARDDPDQNAVQQVAERQAKTIASLLVEKEQLQSKVYKTVLTPDQRLRADVLRARWESHLDHAAEHLGKESAAK